MWIKRFQYWTLKLNPKSIDSLFKVILKVTLSFTPIHATFTPYPLFQWYPQSKEIILNLNMECWNSGLNLQEDYPDHLMHKVRE
jgi:hypothetical protein